MSDKNSESTSGTSDDEKKTLLWCRWTARKPLLMFGITGGVHLAFVIISVALWLGNYDILPIVFNEFPLKMNNDEAYLKAQAWNYKDDDIFIEEPSTTRERRSLGLSSTSHPRGSRDIPNTRIQLNINMNTLENDFSFSDESLEMGHTFFGNTGPLFHPRLRRDTHNETSPAYNKNGTSSRPDDGVDGVDAWEEEAEEDTQERQKRLTSLTIVYEVPGGNVFSRENLKKIAELERKLYNMRGFQLNHCRLMSYIGARICEPFFSVIRYFDGTWSDSHDDLFDPNFRDVAKVLNVAYSHIDTVENFKFFLSKNNYFNKTSNTAVSDMTRTSMTFGYPLSGFGNDTDSRRRQQNKLLEWFKDEVKPFLDNAHKQGHGNMKLSYSNLALYYDEVFDQVFEDWKLLIGAFLFIFCFMWFQTGSLFISTFGIGSIITSFCGANLIYNVVIGYKFFGIFNVMAIFIILGIGADDIFIFNDTWVASEVHSREKLEYRLSVCYKRAAIAMFVTSLTTMTAFFVSGISPILPIAAFGVFAGATVCVNYISVITFFPAVVIVYHIYFENKRCLCCCNRSKYHSDEETNEKNDPSKEPNGLQVNEDVKGTTQSCSLNLAIMRMFSGPCFKLATNKVGRWVVLAFSFALVGLAIYLSTRITLDDQRIKLFGPDYVQEVAQRRMTYGFVALVDEPVVKVRVVWGMKPQDMSMCPTKAYDPENECNGQTVWDRRFTMNAPESQEGLLKFCQNVKSMGAEERDKLMILNSKKTNENNITCFIENMAEFFKRESTKPQYPPGVSLDLPITKEKVNNLIKYNPDVYRAGAEKIVTHPFELAVDYWLHYGYTNESVPDEVKFFKSEIGLHRLSRFNLAKKKDEGRGTFGGGRKIYPHKMIYMSVEITTTMARRQLALTNALPLMDTWETFISSEVKQLPGPLQGGFQTTRSWVWIKILESILNQGLISVGVGLLLAFVVILIGTQNLITALLAVICLAFISICVFAVLPVMEWKFGIIEAMNTCLVVGLAVDYVVHLAEGYHLNRFYSRGDRLKDALHHVGISILSGAITTAGSSFFMLFAKIVFFKQFGTFVFSTIIFSFLFSFIFLATSLGVIGPQGLTGSFLKLCKKGKKYESQDSTSQKTGTDNVGYERDSTNM